MYRLLPPASPLLVSRQAKALDRLRGFRVATTVRSAEENLEVAKKSDIAIRQMSEEDVPALVELHSEVFKGYNATMMGNAYLESLYRTLATHTACVAIVVHDGGEILGWIGGVGDWRSFERTLMCRSLLRAPTIVMSILRNRPTLLEEASSITWRRLRESIQTLWWRIARRGTSSAFPEPQSALRAASLLVIAVTPLRQKQHIGQIMMEDFHGRLSSKGFAMCTLSVFSDNVAANRAFEKVGYLLSWARDGVNHYAKYLT
jgi:ribosomal protein S18 acetylase RimI-like enzyme